MTWKNLSIPFALLGAALSLELAIAPSLVAQTQPTQSPEIWITFTPPPGEETPDRTASGATRVPGCPGDTIENGEQFSSLIPENSETNSERPTFAVNIPKTVAQKAFFSLRDANEDYFYQTELPLPETSGMYRLPLPDDAPSIVPNKKYQWSLSLICRQNVDPNDPRIGGVIQFLDSSPTLNGKKPTEE